MRRGLLALAVAASAACGRGDLGSADSARRAEAVRALAGEGGSLAALVVAQRDPSPAVRAAAAEAFAARRGPAAADALGDLVVDPSPEVASAAARGLAAMPGEPRARAHLVQRYAGATPAGRAAIADALDRMGVSLREAVESEARLLWERNVAALGMAGDAREGAAEELGASGRAEAVQRLLPLLDPARNPDRGLAAAAARGLGEAGEWSTRPHLEALLLEPDPVLAEAAAGALGRLGDPAAADALAAAAVSQPRIGAAAVDALAALPEAQEVGLAVCEVASRSLQPGVALRAAREARRREAGCPERPLLSRIGAPGAAVALAALGELGVGGAAATAAIERVAGVLERAPDPGVRIAAAGVLARLGGPSAAAAVGRRASAVAARIAERRAKAPPAGGEPTPDDAREARALLAAGGALRAPGIEAALAAHAADRDPEIRAGAVEARSRLGGPGAVEAVAAACADPDPAVRVAAVEGLGRLGRQGARALAAVAPGGPDTPPAWATLLARALGETGAAEAVPALAALLDGPAASHAAAALARIGAPDAAAPLAAYLRRVDAPARAEAIEALSQLVSRESAPAIAARLTDERPEVRAAAARAVGKLGHEAASPRLEALRSDYYGRVRRAAVEALAKLPSAGPRARR